MTKDELEREIFDSCQALLATVVEVIKRDLRLKQLPKKQTPYGVMEPTGQGSYAGRDLVLDEPDFFEVWTRVEETIKASAIWTRASDAVTAFLHAFSVKSPSWGNPTSSYLVPLCRSYFQKKARIKYDQHVAQKVVSQLVTHLNAPGGYYVGLAVMANFKAERGFHLADDIIVRPINQKDIEFLVDRYHTPQPAGSRNWIYTDWWVCEIRKLNPRGTYDGQNRISEMVLDDLPLTFRMFTKGDMRIWLGILKSLGPYESQGIMWGGQEERFGSGSQAYNLSSRAIGQFVDFSKDIQVVLANEDHYLQVPLRRMRHAGSRREKADSIIDYVIGIEALLGARSELTEIGYRFRIRGSVILANKRTERPIYIRKLAKLYELRSRIAHGTPVSNKDLDEYLPFAEDSLRHIWKWFFTHYRDEKSNEAGIDRIDSDLVVK